ncbi:hypothetical protein LXL04_019390 [Taraxacum kok-saghyz]
MDLFFEPDKGTPFCIEVGYFDTIREIKEKVTKYHGIPVHEQTLMFKGRILPDDLNIHTSNILDSSHLKLMINSSTSSTSATSPTTNVATTDPPQPPPPVTTTTASATKVKIEEAFSPSSCSSSHKIIKLFLKPFGVAIEMDPNDSVLRMKEKISEMEGIAFGRLIVYANGSELIHDRKTLHECQLVDGSEVEITMKPPTPTPPPTPTITMSTTTTTATAICSTLSMNSMGNNNYSKKLKVNVMSKCGDKITLEVNPLSNVGELRKELQKVRSQGVGFRLPEEGYFFIYKQNVMEEDQSFRWHQVAQGDTVEIFNGCVTGGS